MDSVLSIIFRSLSFVQITLIYLANVLADKLILAGYRLSSLCNGPDPDVQPIVGFPWDVNAIGKQTGEAILVATQGYSCKAKACLYMLMPKIV